MGALRLPKWTKTENMGAEPARSRKGRCGFRPRNSREMVYDLGSPLQAENFMARARRLAGRGAVVELTERRARTLSQNSYVHVIIGYFAAVTGNTAEWVKREYFKRACNGALFERRRVDRLLGREVTYLRSTSELGAEEMSVAIDRFRDWSAREAGVYLPSADERGMVAEADAEARRAGRWV